MGEQIVKCDRCSQKIDFEKATISKGKKLCRHCAQGFKHIPLYVCFSCGVEKKDPFIYCKSCYEEKCSEWYGE